MCSMLDYDRVFTCSREPVIKLWHLSSHETSGEPLALFEGHEMSVSTVAYREKQGELLASAGRDCTTRVWNVETQQCISKRKISRNVVTGVKWLPNSPDLFVETSEDLYMRVFDIRRKPFKPVIEFKVDTNFATTCDLWSDGNEDRFLVTGHRGFNGAGAEVKLWDLRKILAIQSTDNLTSQQLTTFEYSGH